MCEFDSLYNGDEGYVIRCKQCGNYQLAFLSTVLTLSENNFESLCKLVNHKCRQVNNTVSDNRKNVAIQTPAEGVFILLTANEVKRFRKILEQADNEVKALSLISMFNPR